MNHQIHRIEVLVKNLKISNISIGIDGGKWIFTHRQKTETASKIPILPITFGDNKKRFSYTFFSGSPGIMRVKIHSLVQTLGKKGVDRKEIREEVYDIIHKQLLDFEKEI